jgi:hypothetical protein
MFFGGHASLEQLKYPPVFLNVRKRDTAKVNSRFQASTFLVRLFAHDWFAPAFRSLNLFPCQ